MVSEVKGKYELDILKAVSTKQTHKNRKCTSEEPSYHANSYRSHESSSPGHNRGSRSHQKKQCASMTTSTSTKTGVLSLKQLIFDWKSPG